MERTVSINETPSNYMETVIMVHLIYCEERGNYSPNKVSPTAGVLSCRDENFNGTREYV